MGNKNKKNANYFGNIIKKCTFALANKKQCFTDLFEWLISRSGAVGSSPGS